LCYNSKPQTPYNTPEQVAGCDEAMPPSKHITALPPPLQLPHHSHHLGCITRRDAAALVQDVCKLIVWQLVYMQLQKPAPERAA
jgi:hypothetical protein